MAVFKIFKVTLPGPTAPCEFVYGSEQDCLRYISRYAMSDYRTTYEEIGSKRTLQSAMDFANRVFNERWLRMSYVDHSKITHATNINAAIYKGQTMLIRWHTQHNEAPITELSICTEYERYFLRVDHDVVLDTTNRTRVMNDFNAYRRGHKSVR